MAGLKVKIGADASQFERTMRSVKGEVRGVKTAILGIGAATGAIFAVNKAFDLMKTAAKGAFQFIKASSDEAGKMEGITMQFETLLGSAGAAKTRMKDLVEFAKTTPFQIEGLSEASSMLQGMTQGALASGEGLRLVGDAAAAVNKPLEVVGMNIGKIFQGLTQGGEVAEATNQLMQYGLVTGKAKVQLQEFVKSAKAGERAFLSEAEAMEVLNKMFGQTEGAMERLAKTTEGKKSMVKDAMDQIKVAFGTGFNDGLKIALDATTDFIPRFQEKMSMAGSIIGEAIGDAVEGDFNKLVLIGDVVGTAIWVGIKSAMEKGASELFEKSTGALRFVLDKASFAGGLVGRAVPSHEASSFKDTLSGNIESSGLRDKISALTTSVNVNQRNREMEAAMQFRVTGANGAVFRGAAPGENSPLVDPQSGRRIVQLLEEVAQNTGKSF